MRNRHPQIRSTSTFRCRCSGDAWCATRGRWMFTYFGQASFPRTTTLHLWCDTDAQKDIVVRSSGKSGLFSSTQKVYRNYSRGKIYQSHAKYVQDAGNFRKWNDKLILDDRESCKLTIILETAMRSHGMSQVSNPPFSMWMLSLVCFYAVSTVFHVSSAFSLHHFFYIPASNSYQKIRNFRIGNDIKCY